MSLKPQDVLIVLKLHCLGERDWSFVELGKSLGISVGEGHNAVNRAKASGLIYEREKSLRVQPKKLFDFLVHGVPAAFFPVRGQVTRGMPTSVFAAPLNDKITVTEADIPLVWPTADGAVRGESLMPLYPTVPMAAAADKGLYELLVLVDGLRVGKAREKKLSIEMLEKRIVPTTAVVT